MSENTQPAAGEAKEIRLKTSDQLRIIAGYHNDKLPADVAQELCDLADEWDDQVDRLRVAQNALIPEL